MEDKPEQTQVPVTSEKKKDPKRVAAGKRLAAISKIAKERKRKQAEPNESSSNDSMITYIGVVVALVSLVLAYKSHQRETKELEPKYIPKTVEVTKRADKSNKMSKVNADDVTDDRSDMGGEVYDALLLTAGAIGVSMASKKLLKEPLGTPENTKGMLKLAVSVSLSSLLVAYLKKHKFIPDNPTRPVVKKKA
ncbi:Hypothetical predicted protein [Paramuricea clavata]|uniref:Uncharacterized protein n=1 Tax=Paramuricea clavata TaxID=317549 RepID=A0A7D9HKD1_PARCT|nr:Hypothetical predicted protein [Paramuricea clavata]